MLSRFVRVQSADVTSIEQVNQRVVAFLRLILVAAALVIVIVDPSEPYILRRGTYSVLGLYTLYSAILYVETFYTAPRYYIVRRWSYWLDVAWFVVLVALNSGTNSIFFFGFLFAIMVAAFQQGFRTGMLVASVSALLFSLVGIVAAAEGQGFELNRFLLRPMILLVLGYMLAFWGEADLRYKHRLALLRQVGQLSNPRFGADRTIGRVMDYVCASYRASACLLVLRELPGRASSLRRADAASPGQAGQPAPLPPDVSAALLNFPPEQALLFREPRRWPGWLRRATIAGAPAEGAAAAQAVATILEARTFISVPIVYRGEAVGRGYLLAQHRSAFGEQDIEFLLQLVEQVTPVLDNIRLLDRLATDAATEERQRIARDLHDSVLQPYIGLQLGLAAVRQRQQAGLDVRDDIARLADLTTEGIAELRGYVRDLRGQGQPASDLIGVVQNFARKFSATTGIAIQVSGAPGMRVNDRLAAEALQIAVEGLSNIRRHTRAQSANIQLACANERLYIQIENPQTAENVTPFVPRSIGGRAEALGGQVRVTQTPQHTVVLAEIPL